MVSPTMMQDELCQMLRGIRCGRDSAGNWLCECGVRLSEDDCIQCADCDAKTQRRTEEEQKAREFVEWKEQVMATGAQAMEPAPDWPHLHDIRSFREKISNKSFIAIAERYSPERGSLLLLGPSGSGKTSAAAYAFRRLRQARIERVLAERSPAAIAQLRTVAGWTWATASDVSRALGAHRYGSGAEPALVTRAVQAELLILDELGIEPTHRRDEIFDLVNRRYARSRPTIVTSGLTRAVFVEKYGDALVRRISEAGRGALIDAHGGGDGR